MKKLVISIVLVNLLAACASKKDPSQLPHRQRHHKRLKSRSKDPRRLLLLLVLQPILIR